MKIKIKPLSVNEAWQGKRFKTPKYKAYEKECMLLLKPMKLPPPPYEIVLEWGFSNQASDIDNPEKPFIDILQKKYKFNDKNIYKLVIIKKIVPKGNEYISFDIRNMEI